MSASERYFLDNLPKKVSDNPAADLRALCAYLIDHGAIRLGTSQSATLISVARAVGAWAPQQDEKQ